MIGEWTGEVEWYLSADVKYNPNNYFFGSYGWMWGSGPKSGYRNKIRINCDGRNVRITSIDENPQNLNQWVVNEDATDMYSELRCKVFYWLFKQL